MEDDDQEFDSPPFDDSLEAPDDDLTGSAPEADLDPGDATPDDAPDISALPMWPWETDTSGDGSTSAPADPWAMPLVGALDDDASEQLGAYRKRLDGLQQALSIRYPMTNGPSTLTGDPVTDILNDPWFHDDSDYVAPFLGQAKQVAWDQLKRFAGPIPGARFHESELRVDLPNGGRVRLYGADNGDALRGQYFDDVDCDEFGDWDPRVWTEVIRPSLSDRGGRASFTGTPRGKNSFYDLRQRAAARAEGWRLWEFKASETRLLAAAELEDARAAMDASAYLREYECSFDAAVEGAYYAEPMQAADAEGRIGRAPQDPVARVTTWWDLGIDDATAIWFVQDIGTERRLIDYLEVSGEGLPQIVRRLEERGYRYERHLLPHDAEARELGTGVTRIETLARLGLRDLTVVPLAGVADGINAVRLMLARCWFDAERCARGIEALKQYRREWDAKRQVWRERPRHDWTSHAADAFRYGAMARPIVRSAHGALEIPRLGIV